MFYTIFQYIILTHAYLYTKPSTITNNFKTIRILKVWSHNSEYKNYQHILFRYVIINRKYINNVFNKTKEYLNEAIFCY